MGLSGYAIGYDIFEGNTYEGYTLIPFLEKIQNKFDIRKPIVIVDSGLLSNDNSQALEDNGYQYIIGARLKNESQSIQQQIIAQNYRQKSFYSLRKKVKINDRTRITRLIAHYSEKRARDVHNRKGLERLEKRLKSEKLTNPTSITEATTNISKKGDIEISNNYQKYEKIPL